MDGRPGRIRPFARLPLSMITLLRRLLVFSCALVCGALGAEPTPLRTALLGWEPVPARPDIQRVAADLVASDFAKTTLALAARGAPPPRSPPTPQNPPPPAPPNLWSGGATTPPSTASLGSPPENRSLKRPPRPFGIAAQAATVPRSPRSVAKSPPQLVKAGSGFGGELRRRPVRAR